jgi:hypothetical protein
MRTKKTLQDVFDNADDGNMNALLMAALKGYITHLSDPSGFYGHSPSKIILTPHLCEMFGWNPKDYGVKP